jgi:hypothetical protein
MHEYLNWWMGGLCLGGFTVLFRFLTGRTLGVSGSWKKVAFWRQERASEQAAHAITQNQASAANALLAATLAEFGESAIDEVPEATATNGKSRTLTQAVPWTAHLLFLLCMALGGLFWAWHTGNLHLQYELSAIHNRISGGGWDMVFVLLIGGILVGMGTQMAGGCSSGHGLSGCSNFSWASLVATAIFFSTAVILAFAIKAVMA